MTHHRHCGAETPAAIDGEKHLRGRAFGVLVTFRRPKDLARTLDALTKQSRPPEVLIVVDNDANPENEAALNAYAAAGRSATYIGAGENLGPAGGFPLGFAEALREAQDTDWLLVLDDDNPKLLIESCADLRVLEQMIEFGEECRAMDPHLGGVGITGADFDWRTGRMVRIPDASLHGAVPVTWLAGGFLPVFSVAAIRAEGGYDPEYFWGYEELEHGLRLTRAGYHFYANGDMWLQERRSTDRLGIETVVPLGDLGSSQVLWRRYYTLRNLVRLLLDGGHRASALRVCAVKGVAKPLANFHRSPRLAFAHLRVNLAAMRDAFSRRMGRTIDPDTVVGE